MSMFKGMYVARMLTLILGIQLKGNFLTYVAKKLTILVVLTKTKIQINWVGVVFNNLHCKLRNLGDPSKSNMTKDVEFGGA